MSKSQRPMDRRISVIFGYIPKVDRLPRRLKSIGLFRRYAVVMDSYRLGFVDAFFDSELFLAVSESVGGIVHADCLRAKRGRIVHVFDFPLGLESKGTLRAMLIDEPIDELLYFRGGEVVSAIVSEAWAKVGGPPPYHDSYTMAIYSAIDIANQLEAELEILSGDLQVSISSVTRGEAAPIPSNPLTRLFGNICPRGIGHPRGTRDL